MGVAADEFRDVGAEDGDGIDDCVALDAEALGRKIGRASCRERV